MNLEIIFVDGTKVLYSEEEWIDFSTEDDGFFWVTKRYKGKNIRDGHRMSLIKSIMLKGEMEDE